MLKRGANQTINGTVKTTRSLANSTTAAAGKVTAGTTAIAGKVAAMQQELGAIGKRVAATMQDDFQALGTKIAEAGELGKFNEERQLLVSRNAEEDQGDKQEL